MLIFNTKNKFYLLIGYDDRDLFAKIKRGKFNIPTIVTEDAANLLRKILRVNPDERVTVDQVS